MLNALGLIQYITDNDIAWGDDGIQVVLMLTVTVIVGESLMWIIQVNKKPYAMLLLMRQQCNSVIIWGMQAFNYVVI